MSGNKKNPLQTEFEFTLPKGYVDAEGNLNREGTMRLATAMDEIAPLRDPRVKSNEAYLSVVVLSRVITHLGKITDVNTNLVESLFTADLAYLQDFYRKINGEGSSEGENQMTVTCPQCQHVFEVETAGPGGS
ncbi:MAG: phage tail assembly protein [Anaerolineaceae bacterium]